MKRVDAEAYNAGIQDAADFVAGKGWTTLANGILKKKKRIRIKVPVDKVPAAHTE